MTFGFDTAVSIATEALDRIATTAESHNRIMVVEVMGRTKGWIATYAGHRGRAPTRFSCPRSRPTSTLSRPRSGRATATAAPTPSSSSPRAAPLRAARSVRAGIDAFGFERLGGVGYLFGAELERLTGFETRVTVLGHLQRGGTPTAFDRVLADAVRRRRRRPRGGRAVRRDGGSPRREVVGVPARRGVRARCAASTRRCSTSRRRSSASPMPAPRLDGDRPRRHAAAVRPHRLRSARGPPIAAVRAAGVEVVVATARSPRSARELAADAGIGGVAICANGASVYDLDADRVVAHSPLPAETAHLLVRGSGSGFRGSSSAGSTSFASAASRRTRR